MLFIPLSPLVPFCRRQHGFSLSMSNDPRKPHSRPERRTSPFNLGGLADVLDRMMQKQYGLGPVFYGPTQGLARNNDIGIDNSGSKKNNEGIMETSKENPVLVVGGTGRTGAWVVLGLLNEGINVRVLTRRTKKAEKLFGPSGVNVDVFQGSCSYDGPNGLREALSGCWAVVMCAGGRLGEWDRVDAKGVQRLAQLGDILGVERMVLVSSKGCEDNIRGFDAGWLTAKAYAEQRVRKSKMKYIIVRAGRLNDEQGSMKEIVIKDHDDGDRAALSRMDLAQLLIHLVKRDWQEKQKALSEERATEFSSVSLSIVNGKGPPPSAGFWEARLDELFEG